MLFSDALTLDAPRPLQGGALAVRARAARTGVYQYAGREVDPDNRHGLRDTAMVSVLRDEAAVFDERAVRSFIGKPVTDDHPSAPVTADNWRDHARGTIMGAVRDGDYLAFDLLLTDAATVTKVNGGKRELSNGYACDVEVGDFTAADGTKCQARQKPGSIVGNHVALVDRGRAGSECAICDAIPPSFLSTLQDQTEKPVSRTLTVDGLPVNVADADAATATINRLLEQRDAATGKVTTLEGKAVADAATLVAKDAEIAKLAADLAASKLTPAQMRDAGKAFAVIEGKAKAMGITVTDAMDQDAIMKAVVDKAMPGNTYVGDHIRIAFETLTKDVKADAATTVQPLHAPIVVGDAAARADAALTQANDFNAWRRPAAA